MITHLWIELPVMKPTERPDAHQKTPSSQENIALSNDTEGGAKLVDGTAVSDGERSQLDGFGKGKGKGKIRLDIETSWSRPTESIAPPPSIDTSFIKVDASCKFLVLSPMLCIQV
jgi:hypothetical protein